MQALKQIEESSIEFENLFKESVKKVVLNQKSIYHSEYTKDEDVLEAILKYASGGKRIRPFLVKFFSNKDFRDQDLLNASLAFEMFHLAALIHDDIIDNANLRRSAETMHVFLDKQKQNKQSLGQDLAIIWGDIFLAESLIYASNLEQEIKEIFFTMVMQTMRGQYIDILNADQDYGTVSKDSITAKNELKTAWYTFASPILMGIKLNNQKYNKETINNTVKLAIELGILYQIRDDIIDCQDIKSGKKLFGDIFENQTTWVTIMLKEHYPTEFNKISQIAKLKENPESIEALKQIFNTVDLKSKYEMEKERINKLVQDFNDSLELKQKIESILELLTL